MDSFGKQKQDVLSRIDKSRAGIIDHGIQDVVRLINGHGSYYTTSSCSGRIVLLSLGSHRKKDSRWLLSSHGPVAIPEVENALAWLPDGEVWFRCEPAILHVACRSLDDAQRMLGFAQEAGFKRAGIISLSKRIIVEIFSTEMIDAIVADKGARIASDSYMYTLLEKANQRLAKNSARLEILKKKIENGLLT